MDSPQHNLDQANTKAAIDELQTFVNNNPSSEYRSQTQDRIKELRKKLEKKAYEIAKLYYKTSPSSLLNLKSSVIAIENFQKDFPDSDYNEEMAFLKVQAEYELAKSSFAEKQKERFGEVKKFYDSLAEKFPGSKYIKMAESMSVDSQKRLEVIALAEAKEKAEREKNKPVQNTTKVAGSGN
jgi:outer membrane protein assembly factor BamD